MTRPRVVVTIEARMTSSRLPGKILMEVCGRPMLGHLVDRLRWVEGLDDVVIATTYKDSDDPVQELADRLGVSCYRGSEEDVLGRVLGAAKTAGADVIAEVTGDCPLLDPEFTSQAIREYFERDLDYCSVGTRDFPSGLATQVFATRLLAEIDREFPRDPMAREHVSYPIYQQKDRYSCHWLKPDPPLSRTDLHFELDTARDYEVLKRIFEALYPGDPGFGTRAVLEYLARHPEVEALWEAEPPA